MEKIRLRSLTQTDIETTLAWHNQEDISDLYSGHPFPVNIEMEEKWYKKILTSNFPVTVFGVERTDNQKLIGITLLKDINMINRSAEFALYIGEINERGQGFAKEALKKTLNFGFFKIGLNRITLKVLQENETAIQLYQSAGFIKEGTLRKNVFKNNKFKDEILMGILKEEFNG